MNYPRHIAVQPATATTPKRIWVVNERGHHLQVYNAPTTATAAHRPTSAGRPDRQRRHRQRHFRWPGDVEFAPSARRTQVAIITDRMASSVKVINAVTFAEIDMTPTVDDPDANFIPVAGSGTAVDPATGNIWIGNGTRIRVYSQTGTLVATYGASGTALGQFQDISDLTTATARCTSSTRGPAKVTVANLDGTFATRWGATFGQNPDSFKGPAGIDCDVNGRSTSPTWATTGSRSSTPTTRRPSSPWPVDAGRVQPGAERGAAARTRSP